MDQKPLVIRNLRDTSKATHKICLDPQINCKQKDESVSIQIVREIRTAYLMVLRNHRKCF